MQWPPTCHFLPRARAINIPLQRSASSGGTPKVVLRPERRGVSMRSNHAESSQASFQIIPGGLAQDQSLFEAEIDARLARLSRAVEQFVESLPAALLSEHTSTRELLEELVVKQSALQWIVRVAKHSEPGIRQRMWADIDQSVAGLERSLELLPRLQQIERQARVPHENQCSVASSRYS
jgi:hypothetical protein